MGPRGAGNVSGNLAPVQQLVQKGNSALGGGEYVFFPTPAGFVPDLRPDCILMSPYPAWSRCLLLMFAVPLAAQTPAIPIYRDAVLSRFKAFLGSGACSRA